MDGCGRWCGRAGWAGLRACPGSPGRLPRPRAPDVSPCPTWPSLVPSAVGLGNRGGPVRLFWCRVGSTCRPVAVAVRSVLDGHGTPRSFSSRAIPATLRPVARCWKIHRTHGAVAGAGSRRCRRRPQLACARFGCGPASARRYPYGGRPPRNLPARGPGCASRPAPDAELAALRGATLRSRPRRTDSPVALPLRSTGPRPTVPARAADVSILHRSTPPRSHRAADRLLGHLTLPPQRRRPVLEFDRGHPPVKCEPQPTATDGSPATPGAGSAWGYSAWHGGSAGATAHRAPRCLRRVRFEGGTRSRATDDEFGA